ncbi:MAG TPA: DUF1501 domain-containing protein [Acidobacteriota bacterium]|nr:DUF1501 domain-containing protein [Acidobacteriota bacterium]
MDRRRFLKSLTFLTAASSVPAFVVRSLQASAGTGGRQLAGQDRILVVIELNGGVDGLSAVVPYSNDFYHQARPLLALPTDRVLKVNDDFAFHPGMAGFKELFDRGEVSVIHGVGYPNPTRSHFLALDIWHTARPEAKTTEGWLAQYVDALPNPEALAAVNVGGNPPLAMISSEGTKPAIRSIESFKLDILAGAEDVDATPRNLAFEQLQSLPQESSLLDFTARTALEATFTSDELLDGVQNYSSGIDYPDTTFAERLQTVAKLISADLGVRVFYVTLHGFDTHANQVIASDNLVGVHPRLLSTFSDGVKAFQDDLRQLGVSDRVLTMTVSEFGRRLAENDSFGTDHGTANPLFLIGEGVEPGFFGEHPSLAPDDLDDVGDMQFNIDFRRAYATALDTWLGGSSSQILGEFLPLDVLRV